MKQTGGGYLLALISGILVLGFALIYGFADPRDCYQEGGWIVIHAMGIAGVAGGIVLLKKRNSLKAMLGFHPGIYTLGTRMIDARTRVLKTFDLFDSEPRIVHRYVNGGYRQTTLAWHGFVFTFGRQPLAGQALQQLNANLQQLRTAAQNNDMNTVLALDPIPLGLSLAQSEREEAAKMAQPKKAPASSPAPMLALIGAIVVLSPASWFIRNYASVEAAYSNIHDTYEADAWIRASGNTERGMKKKMEIEMTDAVKWHAEDAAELRRVLDAYPDAPDDLKKPVEDALKTRYETARKDALALSANEQLTWFINQVYDKLETHGVKSVMQVKLARTDNTQLQKLDDFVAADPELKKQIVPVAKYFGTSDEESRKERLRNAVVTGMQKFFPADVMTFDGGKDKPSDSLDTSKDDIDRSIDAKLDAAGDKPAAAKDSKADKADKADDADAKDETSIEIFYVIRPKYNAEGVPSTYTEIDDHDKPIPGAPSYPGIEFELGATLKVPGYKGDPHQVDFTARPAPTISVEHTGPRPNKFDPNYASSLDNSAVYSAMSDSAFEDLQQKLVVALGGKPDKAAPADPNDTGSVDDPACKEMSDMLEKVAACKGMSKGDQKKLTDTIGKLADAADSNADESKICKQATTLVLKALAKAGCE
nr:hypothetical protein [Kofleriaceae bacterium]